MIFRALILASIFMFGCSSDDSCGTDSAVEHETAVDSPADPPVDTPVDSPADPPVDSSADTDPAVDSAV